MGLFGNDKEQDTRLEAIENWLQGLTEVVQKHRLDLSELRVDVMKLQAQAGEKLEASDFDPAILQLSDKITEARLLAEQAAEAAGQSWAAMQRKAMDALEQLDEELDQAADRANAD